MKQLLFALVVCLTFVGCKDEIAPPFAKEKIQSILTQIHLTDASVTKLFGEQKDSMSTLYLEQVKEINNITDQDIESIFEYLKEHPKFAEEIYGNMILALRELPGEKEK